MRDKTTGWMVCNTPGDASPGIWGVTVGYFDEEKHPCLGSFPLIFMSREEAEAIAAYCASRPVWKGVRFRVVEAAEKHIRVWGICDGERLLRDPETAGSLPRLDERLAQVKRGC